MGRRLNLFCLALTLGPSAFAQPVSLAPRDLLVVTTDGLFRLPAAGGFAASLAPAAAFGGLASPAIEWVPGTDEALVVTGTQLFRVAFQGSPPSVAAIVPLPPNLGGSPLLFDLDLHPGTGELWLLDRGNGFVHRFDPPFAPGVTPIESVAVPKSTRGMCIDARVWPRALVIAGNAGVQRLDVASGQLTMVSQLAFATAVDAEPDLSNHPMAAKSSSSQIVQCVSPNLVANINIGGLCAPVALNPVDVEWNPTNRRLYALAQDGINPCWGAFTGPNHVVRFQVPGGGPNPPVVLTSTAGSGITGTQGDLCVVQDDFAWGYRFGPDCPATNGVPSLDHPDGIGLRPSIGNSAFTLEVRSGPSAAPAWLLLGTSEAALPLGNCTAVLNPMLAFSFAAVDTAGALDLPAPVPNQASLVGATILAQVALLEANGLPVVTNGLRLHLGL